MYEKALKNAMDGKVSANIATGLATLHSRVCSRIFCGYCQGIMYSRESVMISGGPEGSALAKYGTMVLCGNCFDKGKASGFTGLEGASVLDSRKFKMDGTPKKPRKLRKSKEKMFRNIAIEGGFRKIEIHSLILVNIPKAQASEHFPEGTGDLAYQFFIHGERGDWNASCSLTGRRVMRRATLREVKAELPEQIINILGAYIDAVTSAKEENRIAPVVE